MINGEKSPYREPDGTEKFFIPKVKDKCKHVVELSSIDRTLLGLIVMELFLLLLVII